MKKLIICIINARILEKKINVFFYSCTIHMIIIKKSNIYSFELNKDFN